MKKISNVFWISLLILFIAVIFGVCTPKRFEQATANLQAFITSSFGWYYLILVSVIVLFSLFLIISPIGALRLGKTDEKPEFSNMTWFAMLFSAGMGIGLVFWGAAEPISHFAIHAPLSEPGTEQALKEAMRFTYFHWGIHAWGIYAIVALCLAYFKFRKGEPGLISATLTPILGKYAKGKIGVGIDVIAVFATVVGVATTLGFGAAQINGGLSYLFNVPVHFRIQVIIIIIVTFLFIFSAWSGLGKGIKYLSNTNMVLAIALSVLMFIVGPTLFILDFFTDTLGTYFQNLIRMSFQIAPFDADHREWINRWTIFYWAWWIAWSPFVGIFIARVSRGRTIREFIIGVLLVPSIVSFFWFAVFGSSAVNVQLAGNIDLTQFLTEEVLFNVFSQYPMGSILSIIAIALVCTFFITSADSATFVLGMQTTYGSLYPPNRVKLIWGIAQSGVALILLYSGGLQGLQNALIIAAFPFSLIIIMMLLSLYKALSAEKQEFGNYLKIIKKQQRKTQ